MADGVQQFNPLDEPVLNSFELPAFCNKTPPDAERPCCGPCTDWLFCLKRTPLEMVLPGFDFSDWLPMVSMSASKLLPSSGAFSAIFTDSDGTNEFEGTYLALPDSEALLSAKCARRGTSERCSNTTSFSYGTWAGSGPWGWFGWWWGYGWGFSDPLDYEFSAWYDVIWDYYGDRWDATHHTTLPRTVYAPAADYGQVKNFYVDAQVKCVLNEYDEPCLQFVAVLRFAWEKPSSTCLACTDAEYGIDACNSAILAAVEAAGGWSTPANEYQYCIPLMQSALIPLEGLVWEDLTTAIPLEVIEPPEWTVTDDGVHDPYWTITGGSFGGGVFPELGPMTEVGWSTSTVGTACDDEDIACGGSGAAGTAGTAGSHETGYDCGEDEPWLPSGCNNVGGLYSYGKVCVPKPITVNEGTATIRVISESCRPPSGCPQCSPDEENPQLKIPAEFAFTISGGTSCIKQFTPQASDCLNIVKVYWSFGEVSDGLGPVVHTLRNTAEDGIDIVETITAVAVDDRGCLYCFTDTADCGCCEGVSGSLSIEASGEEGCTFTLTASVTATEACPQAFLEIQIIEPGSGDDCDLEEFPGACTCEQVAPGNTVDPPCEGWLTCIQSLTDGQTTVRTIFGKASVRYRVWDGPCGCASDWVEFPIHCGICECCLGTITAIYATVSGWGDGGGCPACSSVNKVYALKPQTGGVNDCIWDWNFGAGAGEDDEFLCDPEDPFSNWPIQAFYTIGCAEYTNDPEDDLGIPDTIGTFSLTAGGAAAWEKHVPDTGIPGDCTDLNGSHTRVSNTDGVCQTAFANCTIDIEVA